MFAFLKKHRRRLVVGAVLFLGVTLLAGVLGVRFPRLVLLVKDELPSTEYDCMVVLGGEFWTRIPHAFELYQSNAAPIILLTGSGDAAGSRSQLIERGVPDDSILLETNSTSTAENARYTVPMLRERGFTNVVLVTSWYHSRRALNCFEHFGPDLNYISCPTEPSYEGTWPDKYDRKRVLQEYAKLIGYWPRHGIAPWRGAHSGKR